MNFNNLLITLLKMSTINVYLLRKISSYAILKSMESLKKFKNLKSFNSLSNLERIPKNFIDFPFKYRQEMDVTITDLTNLGLGVARPTLNDGGYWGIVYDALIFFF